MMLAAHVVFLSAWPIVWTAAEKSNQLCGQLQAEEWFSHHGISYWNTIIVVAHKEVQAKF